MKNLFNFIFKHVHWLLFLLLTTISLYLLVHNSEFQRSKYLAVFQEIAGRVYSVTNSAQSYMNLKKINTDLLQRIATLEEEIQIYKNELNRADYILPDTVNIGIDQSVSRFNYARVKQNRISAGPNNYIILDKGSNHGIKEDMAVISAKGIVGVVRHVSSNFSNVIPLLNPKYRLSGMIKNRDFFGDLLWDGKDPRYISLIGLPSHASYSIGDTIVTSGYSAVFPKGVLVGVVEGSFKQKNEESNSLKVRLFTDFSTLKEVFIVENPYREEQILLEKGVDE